MTLSISDSIRGGTIPKNVPENVPNVDDVLDSYGNLQSSANRNLDLQVEDRATRRRWLMNN